MVSSLSRTTLIIQFSYMSAFGCLQLLPEAGKKIHTTPPQSTFPRLAADALLLPAAVATFGLTSLLLCAYMSALGRPDAVASTGAGRRRFVDRLASVTAAAATVALILLAWVVAGGVDWLNVA